MIIDNTGGILGCDDRPRESVRLSNIGFGQTTNRLNVRVKKRDFIQLLFFTKDPDTEWKLVELN